MGERLRRPSPRGRSRLLRRRPGGAVIGRGTGSEIERAVNELKAIDWRLNELVIMPVTKLEPPDDAVAGQ